MRTLVFILCIMLPAFPVRGDGLLDMVEENGIMTLLQGEEKEETRKDVLAMLSQIERFLKASSSRAEVSGLTEVLS